MDLSILYESEFAKGYWYGSISGPGKSSLNPYSHTNNEDDEFSFQVRTYGIETLSGYDINPDSGEKEKHEKDFLVVRVQQPLGVGNSSRGLFNSNRISYNKDGSAIQLVGKTPSGKWVFKFLDETWIRAGRKDMGNAEWSIDGHGERSSQELKIENWKQKKQQFYQQVQKYRRFQALERLTRNKIGKEEEPPKDAETIHDLPDEDEFASLYHPHKPGVRPARESPPKIHKSGGDRPWGSGRGMMALITYDGEVLPLKK